MAYQFHHCSTTLPCYVCLNVFLHTSLHFLFFCLYSLCAMYLQCTIPLMYISASMLCLLLHTSITPNNNHTNLFFFLHSYSLYAPSACNMRHVPACSPPPTFFHIRVFSCTSLFHNYPISCVPRCLSLFCISCSL